MLIVVKCDLRNIPFLFLKNMQLDVITEDSSRVNLLQPVGYLRDKVRIIKWWI